MTHTLDELARRIEALERKLCATPTVSMIIYDKEYDRVLQKMDTIKATYGGHQSWDPKDRDCFQKLKTRRDELRKLLNIQI